MSAASPHSAETLVGVLERIIFFNEENHYTIAELRPETGSTGHNARAGSNSAAEEPAPKVTIVGALPGVECGETLHLRGEWTHHTQHGPQFRIAEWHSQIPRQWPCPRYRQSILQQNRRRLRGRYLSRPQRRVRPTPPRPGYRQKTRHLHQTGLGRQTRRTRAIHLPANLRREPLALSQTRQPLRQRG